jgi:putative heme iron utilization protein
MDPAAANALKTLLESQQVAALGTLHNGEPAVSMVPYALLPGGGGCVIHVSRLATHTADMQRNPAVGLLVVAPVESAPTPQALARASIRGTARPCTPGGAEHADARAAYLARFPQTEEIFALADFSLFAIAVRSVRFVGGFAAATSILAVEFVSIMSAPST